MRSASFSAPKRLPLRQGLDAVLDVHQGTQVDLMVVFYDHATPFFEGVQSIQILLGRIGQVIRRGFLPYLVHQYLFAVRHHLIQCKLQRSSSEFQHNGIQPKYWCCGNTDQQLQDLITF